MQYEVKADIYEGPLPFLVELARYNLIDIFLIKLVDLTQDYLARVKEEGVDLNDLAEPLPLLGNLVAIKARLLLPKPPQEEEEEEVPVSLDELERRLKEYEQFKTVSQLLSELHALQHKHFTRPRGVGADTKTDEPQAPARPFPVEIEVGDLVAAFGKVLNRATALVYEVKAEPWTVEQKVEELRVQLRVKRRLQFSELFSEKLTTLELVVTFLALLELMRQRFLRAIQEQNFGNIVIELRGESGGAGESFTHHPQPVQG